MPETDLATDVAALEAKLTKGESDSENLGKALDVAALALQQGQQGSEETGATPGATIPLSKASTDEEDDDDEDDDTADWIKRIVQGSDSNKSYDLEQSALAKALDADMEAVDVTRYLTQENATREQERRELKRLRKEHGALVKALVMLRSEHQTAMKAQNQALGLLCKAMHTCLERLEGVEDAPVRDSKFAGFGKSLASVQAQLQADGNHKVTYNKDAAARLLQKGAIDKQQHAIWKNTDMLPAHVSLAVN